MNDRTRTVRARLLVLVLAAATVPVAPALAEPSAATVERFFSILEARDRDALVRLLDEDVTTVLPYTASGDTAPEAARTFEGRAATMGYFEGAMKRIEIIRFEKTRITPAQDGHTVFTETRGDMRLANGRRYENLYVWRFEVEDGRIANITEYFNPVTAALAFGRPLGPEAD